MHPTPPKTRPSLLARAIDWTFAQVSPARALRRAQHRTALSVWNEAANLAGLPGGAHHDAARRDRTVYDWNDLAQSADSANLPELATITARSRRAQSNDWAARSINRAFKRNVIGTGLWPRPVARDDNDKLLRDYNRKALRRFKRWARNPKVVDTEKRKTLNGIIRLAFSEFINTGSGFVVLGTRDVFEGGRLKLKLTLQAFELEQLANDFDIKPRPGNTVRNGLELDKQGAVVAYWVHTEQHPLDGVMPVGDRRSNRTGQLKPQRIEAERVLHLHEQDRPRETLPVTPLSPVLHQLYQRQSYDAAELLAKKIEAFLAIIIRKNSQFGIGQLGFNPVSGESAAPAGGDSQDAGGNRRIDFTPGTAHVLYEGEDITTVKSDRPGANYEPYTKRQIGMAAAGAGTSYAQVARDFTQSYAAQRASMLEDNREFDPLQQLTIDLVLRPIYELFIRLEILNGDLEAPGFFDDPDIAARYLEADWQGPPRPWVDPAKEAAAAKIAMDYRLDDRGSVCAQKGGDVLDKFDDIAEQREYASEKGIDLPEDVNLKPKVSPSEPKPRQNQAQSAHDRVNGNGRLSSTDRITESILQAAVQDSD